MRYAPLVFAVVSSTVIGFVACTSDNEETLTPVTGQLRMSPLCGQAGDVVSFTVPPHDGCRSHEVVFHPGVGVPGSVTTASDGTCTVTATVPEAARSGKVEVRQSGSLDAKDKRHETSEAFTIPCPGDSGPPDSPVDSGPDTSAPAGPPLNALFLHRRFAQSTIVNTQAYTFAKLLDDAQRAAIARHEAIVRSELAPPGIAVGSCATLDLPAAGADFPKPVYRGPLSLKAGTSTVFEDLQCDANFVYQKSYPHASFTGAPIWELAWAGDRMEEGFTIPDATGPIPSLGVTTPNPALFDIDVPQGAFTVVWNATVAKLMTIHLLRSSGAPVVCVPDPLAGTFTIPASFIGGPGEVQMSINGGDLRRLAIAQLTLAIMTMQIHSYEFTLHVQ